MFHSSMLKTLLASVRILALCLPVVTALAQSAPEAADSTGKPRPKAQVRVFAFPLEGTTGTVVARGSVGDMETPVVMASAPAGRSLTDEAYQDFAAGQGVYEFLSGDQVVASGPLRLMPNRAYTLVAWQGTDRAWQTKLFADDSTAASRPMRVLNFVSGRPSVVATEGSDGTTVPPATVQELQVPAKILDLRAKVQDPKGGPPFQTSTGFDFSQAGSGYLLISPDYRGKPDVRVLAGGFIAAESPETATATVSVPPTASDIAKEAEQTKKRSLAYLKTALADLEALQAGPNPIPNADEIRRDLQKQLRALQGPPAQEASPAAAAE